MSNTPRRGDVVRYRGEPVGTVSSVDGNLCWVRYFKSGEASPFIWRFHDGLNTLHDWPGKAVQS